ncbi:pyridoxamine 5'-phosphate oxidase family protein [Halorussus litoreus]|uniref:pyridoxamine 5'-phosphate oxidase family protein n=1 Tax=Halorussus litoreus TaxID=1710536 RepID=UPI000E258681|nr:pyridoxamine 5'-phosphate oxidase family protein [Halorussus litoreus]
MDDDAPENASDSIRYQGKAVDDDEEIVAFLDAQRSGVLGLADDGQPHLVTQLFVYDDEDGAIYLHGAQAGRAYGIVADGGSVDGESAGGDNDDRATVEACFTTSEMGRFIPADEPVNFTVEYTSVVAYGEIGLVEDAAAKRGVLERFMAKFAPHLSAGQDYEEMAEESIDRTAVYRLDVERWSGKHGEKAPEYPGAYDLDEVAESE